MARRTVHIKIEIRKPDEFLTLCEDVIKEHIELGATSPFAAGNLVDMNDYDSRVTLARQERNKALEHYACGNERKGKINADSRGGITKGSPVPLRGLQG